MSIDLPLLTDKPRLVTTLAGNPGGRVMQSFTRAPWTDEYYVAYVDSVVSGGPSNLRIARCDSSGAMLDYAVLQGGGHGASITAEYESGKVWIWLFWGSDVGYGTGTAVRWAYNGTPNGATVLLADAQTVPDPGAGDPGHVNGYFAIDQAKDRIATKFSSGTTETYTLWKLSDYKAGTGSPLFTTPTTWPTGDLSAFQGFTTSDKALYITRGGSSVTDQAPTLYELDWATGAITASMDISQLAATTSAGADGGHNEAEGVCLWRDSGGNPELLFGIDTGPTSNRSGLIFRLAAPVDGTATKTVQIDAENVTGASATNVVASFRYDRTVRSATGGFTPTAFEQPVKLSESSTVELKVSDHPDLTDDSYGFVIHATLAWDDQANPGRRKQATYTAQLSAADPAVIPLSQRLVASGAVSPGQVIAGAPGQPGAPGHSPVVTMVGDQVAVDGVVQGPHLAADSTTAQNIKTGTSTQTALRAAIPLVSGNGQALRTFRTALANRNSSRCNMVHIGDSITWGHIPTADGVPSNANMWTNILRDTMRGRFPTTTPNAGGFGYISANQTFGATRSDSPIVNTAGSGTNTYGLDRYARILTSGASVAVTFTGTGIDIQYLVWSGGGTFSWAIDGGAATNVATAGPVLNTNNQVQVRGLSATTHTLVVKYVSGGSCFVGGYYAYNGDEAKGIGSWTLALPGSQSTWWSDSSASTWADGLAWAKPDLVTIELGANDYNQSAYVPVATFQTNITTLIATVKAKAARPVSIVLMPVWELTKTGANPSTWQAYVDAMYAVAAADPLNVCIYDAGERVRIGNPSDTAGALLCPSDRTHLMPVGNRYIAESLATFLGPQ